MGTRRIRDWTPIPMVCCSWRNSDATIENVAGSDSELQAEKKNAPINRANGLGQRYTIPYPAIETALKTSRDVRWPKRSVSQAPG